ncbi:MAG: TRAP transporter small permease subunit [Mycobacterium sp.]
MPPADAGQVGTEAVDLDPDDYDYLSPIGRRNKILAFFEVIENVVSIALMLVIFGAMLLQVVSRRFFEPAPWTDELARYSNIALCAAAAALAMALRKHITVDLIDRWLSPRAQDLVRGATSLLVAVIAAAIVWLSLPYVAGMGARVSVAMQVPIAALFSVVLVGLALQAMHALVWAWHDFAKAFTGPDAAEREEAQ